MKISYKRDYNHNYLVLPRKEAVNFQSRMLCENRIQGLLSASLHQRGDHEEYCYEISSRQTLLRVFEKREMEYSDICKLIRVLADTFNTLIEYLLDTQYLWLHPEYVYVNMETDCVEFVFYPEELLSEDGLMVLSEFILNRINHEDRRAVMLSYQFFKMAREENFVLNDILTFMENMDCNPDVVDTINPGQNSQSGKELEIQYKQPTFDQSTPPGPKSFIGQANRSNVQGVKQYDYEVGQETEGDKRQIDGKKWRVISTVFLAVTVVICTIMRINYVVIAVAFAITVIVWVISGSKKSRGNRFMIPIDQSEEEVRVNESKGYSKYLSEQSEMTTFCSPAENGTMVIAVADECVRHCLVPANLSANREINLVKLPLLVGKLENSVDVVLSDPSISRLHARFFAEGDNICVEDLNTTNGVFVNGNRLNACETMQITVGDTVKLGNCEYVYR